MGSQVSGSLPAPCRAAACWAARYWPAPTPLHLTPPRPHLHIMLHVMRDTPQGQLGQPRATAKIERPQHAAVAVVQRQHLAARSQRHNLLAEAVYDAQGAGRDEAGVV